MFAYDVFVYCFCSKLNQNANSHLESNCYIFSRRDYMNRTGEIDGSIQNRHSILFFLPILKG